MTLWPCSSKKMLMLPVMITTTIRKLLIVTISLVSLSVATNATGTVPPTVTQAEALAALRSAESVLGTRYVWGGQGQTGFDCSGLVIWAYSQSVPGLRWRYGDSTVFDTTAHGLFMYNAIQVTPEDVWPGDLVFVTSSTERITHMGMFSHWLNDTHTKFAWIEASSLHRGVIESVWYLGKQNEKKWLVGVGRMLKWPAASTPLKSVR